MTRGTSTTALLAVLLTSATAGAQSIATDGSVGPAVTLSGPAYDIPQSLGRVSGGNLFHSFERFGLAGGESARFSTDSPAIGNVLARVTGGGTSHIAGTIALAAPAGATPALYLINPAGVVFGQGAAIDVPGGFHVSTADRLRFADGDFWADPARPGVFSVAAPEAFGFLGDGAATIRVEDAGLVVGDQALSVVAGDVVLARGGLASGGGRLTVVAQGGQAGDVPLDGTPPAAGGHLQILPGGQILSVAGDGGAAADIVVAAGRLSAAGDPAAVTGITGIAGGSGPGAALDLSVTGELGLGGDVFVGTQTFGSGAAGDVRVVADSLTIDGHGGLGTRLGSEVGTGASGDAGAVSVMINGATTLHEGGFIVGSTFGEGMGGSVTLGAGSLLIDGAGVGAGVSSRAGSGSGGDAGEVTVTVDDALVLRDGGSINSSTQSRGAAGTVRVRSGSLEMDGADTFVQIGSDVGSDAIGDAGAVLVEVAGTLHLHELALISSSTFGAGDAGRVDVIAGRLEAGGGSAGTVAGIFSDSNVGATGAAGNVSVAIDGALVLRDGGVISSSTFSGRDAGAVTVRAATLEMEGSGETGALIRSRAADGSSGQAGSVDLLVNDAARIGPGGLVAANSFGTGDAGSVRFQAGQLSIVGDGERLTGVFSDSFDSDGAGGEVVIVVDGLTRVERGGLIRTGTSGAGAAGDIHLETGALAIEAGADGGTTGILSDGVNGAGRIELVVADTADLRDGGVISSSTSGPGDGGDIRLTARSLQIEGTEPSDDREPTLTGILTVATGAAQGRAGSIRVDAADEVRISVGGTINASTFGAGAAGSVHVIADRIRLESLGEIAARAGLSSTGQPGDVTVEAQHTLEMDRALVVIENAGVLADPAMARVGKLRIVSPRIRMTRGALVSAGAEFNAPASTVDIHFEDWLFLDFAAVTTEAGDGSGGAIRVSGDGVVVLRDAALATSVFGELGDGGDIAVDAAALVLGGGYVQANTTAADARGGDIAIAVDAVIPSLGRLQVGGSERVSFFDGLGVDGRNVIQAAAPTGVNGVIRVPAGVVDVAGSLLPLAAPPFDLAGFDSAPCRRARGNRFALGGSGVVPVLPGDVLPRAPAPAATGGGCPAPAAFRGAEAD
ncbi:MAG: filamentous hemagglutinin N-terminal domain-containing protein [Rhodocyclaceae bacterium]|nr:filamentous hemagglutinin N-terminal domain-containing protein [Rhodocyclaceae bacterium]